MKRHYALFLITATLSENSCAMLSSSRLMQTSSHAWSAVRRAATAAGTIETYKADRDQDAIVELMLAQMETLAPESTEEQRETLVQETLINTHFANVDNLVCRIHGQTVGLIQYRISDLTKSAHLLNLSVATQYRNTGIGRALINKAFEQCAVEKVRSITVRVPINWYLENYFKKFGFSRTNNGDELCCVLAKTFPCRDTHARENEAGHNPLPFFNKVMVTTAGLIIAADAYFIYHLQGLIH
jgi:ribosomal protein S18 acetylase RimI-like enzyme